MGVDEHRTRQDIQVLRGYAVLLVVFSHAGFGPRAGYLGVDIFFVISGYLVTRLVRDDLSAGIFNFWKFYYRRAKRLLPAAYATLAASVLAAPLFLGTEEMAEFRAQVLGAATFTSNYVLWAQSGYFDTEAKLKPLLHMWSLSLEEQYYLLLPLLLLVVRRRFWPHVMLAIVAASAGVMILWLGRDPSAAFFWLASRAWELALGSLVALLPNNVAPADKARSLQVVAATATLLAIPFFPIGGTHPGINAASVCAATAVLLINPNSWLERARFLMPLAKVGDASYSIYLVHWPIIAFANNAFLVPIPLVGKLVLLGLSLGLGLVLYLVVERPIHRAKSVSAPALARGLAACTLALGVWAGWSAIPPAKAGVDFAEVRKANYGFGRSCSYSEPFRPLPACRSSEHPEIFVWGDSLAMHLVPAIVASGGLVEQATRSECVPVRGYSHYTETGGTNEAWARRCILFNNDVYQYLSRRDSIKTVVIGSTFTALTNRSWKSVVAGIGDERTQFPVSRKRSARLLSATVRSIQSLGKKVVLVAPPPSTIFDIALCLERKMHGLVTFNDRDCLITADDDLKRTGKQLDLLKKVSKETGATLFDFRRHLCKADACITTLGGVPLYRDRHHFSVAGSKQLGLTIPFASMLTGAE